MERKEKRTRVERKIKETKKATVRGLFFDLEPRSTLMLSIYRLTHRQTRPRNLQPHCLSRMMLTLLPDRVQHNLRRLHVRARHLPGRRHPFHVASSSPHLRHALTCWPLTLRPLPVTPSLPLSLQAFILSGNTHSLLHLRMHGIHHRFIPHIP